jgi:hypothetical protein
MDEAPSTSTASLAADRDILQCAQFSTALGVTGASMTVFGDNYQSTICASDSTAARGDALQLELGEGPHWEALSTGLPVLAPDLARSESWPLFASGAREIGMAAAYAFPMTMGAVVVGAVDLYCDRVQILDARQIALGRSMASRSAIGAVRQATLSANSDTSSEHHMGPALRREVHQATGMIQAQLGTTATVAFARLRAHAFSSGRAIEDISRDVVARQLDFSTLAD